MWENPAWTYIETEGCELWEWAKCGDSNLSVIPTVLWAAGTAALTQRILTALFRRFLFRRVPLWETVLQNLLFIWMVIYSLHFWTVLVKLVKTFVEYCLFYEESPLSDDDVDNQKMIEQWLVWMCGVAPLAVFIQTRQRPENTPLMIWITTSPWQRREMGPYGYYLNRPLSLPPSPNPPIHQPLRRAFSDSRILIKEPLRKKRYSKSV